MPTLLSSSRLLVAFDDEHLVANADSPSWVYSARNSASKRLVQEFVDVRPFPGRRVATLVHAMVRLVRRASTTPTCCVPVPTSSVLSQSG